MQKLGKTRVGLASTELNEISTVSLSLQWDENIFVDGHY